MKNLLHTLELQPQERKSLWRSCICNSEDDLV